MCNVDQEALLPLVPAGGVTEFSGRDDNVHREISIRSEGSTVLHCRIHSRPLEEPRPLYGPAVDVCSPGLPLRDIRAWRVATSVAPLPGQRIAT